MTDRDFGREPSRALIGCSTRPTTDNSDPDHLLWAISEVTFNFGLKSVTAVDTKKPVANRIDLCRGMLDHVSYALYDKVEYALFGEPK